MLDRIDVVASETRAHAENRVLILLRRSAELVAGRELHASGAVDLERIVAVGREDDEAVRFDAIVLNARAVREQLVRAGELPGADDQSICVRLPGARTLCRTEHRGQDQRGGRIAS